MAYGADTEELLRRIAAIEDNMLDLSSLDIHSFPPLPNNLRGLCLENNHSLTRIPELPASLEDLTCKYLTIT